MRHVYPSQEYSFVLSPFLSYALYPRLALHVLIALGGTRWSSPLQEWISMETNETWVADPSKDCVIILPENIYQFLKTMSWELMRRLVACLRSYRDSLKISSFGVGRSQRSSLLPFSQGIQGCTALHYCATTHDRQIVVYAMFFVLKRRRISILR